MQGQQWQLEQRQLEQRQQQQQQQQVAGWRLLTCLTQLQLEHTSLPSLRPSAAEALIKMRLHELMPEPYAQLHQRYIKGRGACT